MEETAGKWSQVVRVMLCICAVTIATVQDDNLTTGTDRMRFYLAYAGNIVDSRHVALVRRGENIRASCSASFQDARTHGFNPYLYIDDVEVGSQRYPNLNSMCKHFNATIDGQVVSCIVNTSTWQVEGKITIGIRNDTTTTTTTTTKTTATASIVKTTRAFVAPSETNNSYINTVITPGINLNFDCVVYGNVLPTLMEWKKKVIDDNGRHVKDVVLNSTRVTPVIQRYTMTHARIETGLYECIASFGNGEYLYNQIQIHHRTSGRKN